MYVYTAGLVPVVYLKGRTQFVKFVCSALEELATVNIPTFIVTDLNCPNIDWQSHSRVIGEIDSAFVDFATGNCYVQCVISSNILDMVFCNDPILMSHIDVLPPFSGSDHNAIEFVISCESWSSRPPHL